MPSNTFEIKTIENKYLSLIASDLCSFIPDPELEKATIIKEADDGKKSKNQRKVIHGILDQ